MRTTVTSLVMGAVLLAGGVVAQQKRPQDIDLQAAIRTETVDGDLTGAIKQYGAIVSKYKTDRAVSATALIHMAECYQKLGDAQAKNIYERIVREYGDQRSAVELARTRLGGHLLDAPQALARRRLWTGKMMYGAPSSDGRFLTQAGNGDLAIRDVATGVSRQITNNRKGDPMKNPAYPTISKISPDRKRITVAWNDPNGYQLRVINADGSNEETIYRNTEMEWINPVDWALDGKQVLAKIRTRSSTGQIAWISVAARSARTLKTLPWSSLGRIALSPDTRYIAYDALTGNDSNNRTIFVLASDGSREEAITNGLSLDEVFGWMPDGKTLLFATHRRGSRELWATRVVDGKPAGSPTLIQGDIDSTFEPLGITKNGSLFYWQVGVVGEVNVASVDWSTGAVGSLKKVSEGLIPDVGADWSPDGRRVAFVAHRGSDLAKRFIAIRSIDTGESRDIAPPDADLTILNTGGWSPDGNSFLVIANHGNPPRRIYIVDVKTGLFRPLDGVPVAQAHWMPGEPSLIYSVVERKGAAGVQRLFIRNLDSATDREVGFGSANTPLLALSFAVSPNAATLAFSPVVAPTPIPLNVMRLDGGPARQVFPVAGWVWDWTPDSRRIVYSNEKGIASIPAEGGDPRPLQLELAADSKLKGLSVHPNGRQIVYNSSGQEMEVWVMENLIPTVERALANK